MFQHADVVKVGERDLVLSERDYDRLQLIQHTTTRIEVQIHRVQCRI